jgi:hypothetical protein
MADASNAAQPADDTAVTEQSANPRPRSSGPTRALAWIGIVAGGLFIVAGIFFAGFFLSWSEHSGMGHTAMGHGSMDCCSHMKPDDHMMKHDEMMGPHSGR